MNAYHPAAADILLYGQEGVNVYLAKQLRRQIAKRGNAITDSKEQAEFVAKVLGAALMTMFDQYVLKVADDSDIFQIASELGMEASL